MHQVDLRFCRKLAGISFCCHCVGVFRTRPRLSGQAEAVRGRVWQTDSTDFHRFPQVFLATVRTSAHSGSHPARTEMSGLFTSSRRISRQISACPSPAGRWRSPSGSGRTSPGSIDRDSCQSDQISQWLTRSNFHRTCHGQSISNAFNFMLHLRWNETSVAIEAEEKFSPCSSNFQFPSRAGSELRP